MSNITGKTILEFRNQKKLSRKEVATALNVSEKTIQNWESEDKPIPEKYNKLWGKYTNDHKTINEIVSESIVENKKKQIEFIINKETEEESLRMLAKEGLKTENTEKVINETDNYLKKFFKKLPKKVIIEIWSLFLYVINNDVAIYRKAMAIGALLYFISPIDAIPDTIPIMGFLDDIGVIALAITSYRSDNDFNKITKNAEKELIKKGYVEK